MILIWLFFGKHLSSFANTYSIIIIYLMLALLGCIFYRLLRSVQNIQIVMVTLCFLSCFSEGNGLTASTIQIGQRW